MRVLTAAAMRAVDERAIHELGVPALVLMENAALGVVEALVQRWPGAQRVAIFCGPGNNGGDGLAVARQLLVRGYAPAIWLLQGRRGLAPDAHQQLTICRALGLNVTEVGDEEALAMALTMAREADLVVDALFGTGLARPLEGLFALCAEGLSQLGLPVVAVDLPSGLDASSSKPLGPHAHAELTVTFAALKVAHVLPPACLACGEVAVADLGVPASLVEQAEGDLHLLLGNEIGGLLPLRALDAHKGTFGHLLIVAGSPGKAGAAILAARAAVRTGAGLVTVAVPSPLLAALEAGSIESMTLALPADEEGRLRPAAVDGILEMAERCTAIAVGPGLGSAGETPQAIRRLVRECGLPLVLDADGINAFAGQPEALHGRAAPTILTPHPGELGRLLGTTAAEINEDRLASVREAARLTGCTVALKGHLTLVAAAAGPVAINPTGNAGLASGGSGDVLTGVIGALLAQGLDPWEVACLGAYVHGLAADLLAEEHGPEAIPAGDLAAALPRALAALRTRGGATAADEE